MFFVIDIFYILILIFFISYNLLLHYKCEVIYEQYPISFSMPDFFYS